MKQIDNWLVAIAALIASPLSLAIALSGHRIAALIYLGAVAWTGVLFTLLLLRLEE